MPWRRADSSQRTIIERMSCSDPIPLDEASGKPCEPDPRRKLDEPPPVALNAVADVVLPSAAGLEAALTSFYVGLLSFRREPDEPGVLIFRAERHALRLDVFEPPLHRDTVRPTRLSVDVALAELVESFVGRGIACEWVVDLDTSSRHLLLQDPAGNWLAIDQRSPIR